MASVKNRDTTPEIELRSLLAQRQISGYRLHRKDIPGCPDLAWIGRKIAVFVDGAFWHGHPSAFRRGQSGRFWDEKIARNVTRDRRVDRELADAGWTVIRLWDFEIHRLPDECVARIEAAIEQQEFDA
jgi:DNA mismatch endonuclease (patch repair protein)